MRQQQPSCWWRLVVTQRPSPECSPSWRHTDACCHSWTHLARCLGTLGPWGVDTHTDCRLVPALALRTDSRSSELSMWLVCEGFSHTRGGVMYVHVDMRPPAWLWYFVDLPPQASSFKLMGNFTLFGMVEVMCEVRRVPTQAPVPFTHCAWQAPTPCTQAPILCTLCSCNTCAAQAHPAAAGCISQPQPR